MRCGAGQFEFSFDSVLAMVGDDKAFAAEILVRCADFRPPMMLAPWPHSMRMCSGAQQDFLDEANNDMTGIASVLLEPAPTQDQISCVHRVRAPLPATGCLRAPA